MFYLPGTCTHTDTEKQRKTRVRNNLKSSKKNTIFNEHPQYALAWPDDVFITLKLTPWPVYNLESSLMTCLCPKASLMTLPEILPGDVFITLKLAWCRIYQIKASLMTYLLPCSQLNDAFIAFKLAWRMCYLVAFLMTFPLPLNYPGDVSVSVKLARRRVNYLEAILMTCSLPWSLPDDVHNLQRTRTRWALHDRKNNNHCLFLIIKS